MAEVFFDPITRKRFATTDPRVGRAWERSGLRRLQLEEIDGWANLPPVESHEPPREEGDGFVWFLILLAAIGMALLGTLTGLLMK